MGETSRNVPYCLCFNIIISYVHPIPQSQRTYGTSRDVPWSVLSLNTILCPTCSLSPQGTYGTSRDIPWCPSTQFYSMSHLSVPSHSPQRTYETSRDVPWCPSIQFSVPPVHPIPQSPRDIWDIKGCPLVSLNTILCPTCPLVLYPDPTQFTRGEGVWCHKLECLG